MNLKKLVILGTGGTIAGRASSAFDNVGYVAAQVGIAQLLADIPSLAEGGPIISEQIAQVDSKDMSFAVWQQLAQRVNYFLACDDVQGIVIAHGTDTLEETAYFLNLTVKSDKPVVLVGAMRPATAISAGNPVQAIAIAAALMMRVRFLPVATSALHCCMCKSIELAPASGKDAVQH